MGNKKGLTFPERGSIIAESEQMGNNRGERNVHKALPEKIRAARRKQGLSAYALAMKAGLDKKAIYRIESKESLRTHSLRAQAIADALGCPVEELFDAPGKKGKTA